MWTPAARVQFARDDIPYATSLTDAEWAVVSPFMPAPAKTGRPWAWPMRHVLEGVLYMLRTSCAWAHLLHEFPPAGTVHRWFLRLCRSGVFDKMMQVLAALDRACAGRDPLPTAAVMDAQAARSGTVGVAGPRGYDPARRAVGRKRHALVDTDGRLLGAMVSPASLHDSHGGIALLRASRERWPFLKRCFADNAYAGRSACGERDSRGRHSCQRRTRAERLRRPAKAMGHRTQFRSRRAVPKAGARPRGNRRCSSRLLRPRKRHAARQAAGARVMKRVLSDR